MGNKIFNIQPVKSGKTASAIFKFLDDSKNTLFICKDSFHAEEVLSKIGDSCSPNIIASTELEFIKSNINKYTSIVIDDYLAFTNKKDIYLCIKNFARAKNIYIYSSLNKSFYASSFITKLKPTIPYLALKKVALDNYMSEDVFNDLYYSFLTDCSFTFNEKTSTTPNPSEPVFLSLFDFLGKPAGMKLGGEVYKHALLNDIPTKIKSISNPKYTGGIVMYPLNFLNSYKF
jgi:hypothetical protein